MDVADSGLLTNESDDGSRTPIYYCGTLDNYEHLVERREGESAYREQHVCHVLFHGACVRDNVDRLVHANALASEDGLVYPEATGGYGQDSAIRWNFVAN